ncbi:helix-turn-helix domain-containing protein [Goodfellowiella coeruleoviolacea]|uniref:Helix-turn-helix domain-containing protein n=1 Tax=Goodfellowiella coeruleoviolacea TaxID=334858 RepID=A0AAE3GF46_9PSEU|nr:helix-turn-helix transcriptional regulator [Goodfellowiella coeruleoviolacea]MCP2167102.1 Helix-turn-helix domain-containing protein [Goodfellowiella coeruleoviolacea]
MYQEPFGSALRKRRVEAGLSLDALAKALHYSKGQLSKIENNVSRPSQLLARQADALLGTGGELLALAEEQSVRLRRGLRPPVGNEPACPPVQYADAAAAAADETTELAWWHQFDVLRSMGRHMAPGLVIPVVRASLRPLGQLMSVVRQPEARSRLGLLTARYAEFLGWMAQEAGSDEQSLEWTRCAARIAAQAGDRSLTMYALVRESELALYEHDSDRVISLARRAVADPSSDVRTKGLAAHRLAQGFALRGDHYRCLAALDEAAEWLGQASGAGPAGPVLGSSTVADLSAAVTGWCLYDLGRPQQAAELLERAITQIAPEAHRSRALYGARLALAHEAAGELDRMCDVTAQVLAAARGLGSATVRTQLAALARAVVRRHGHPPAKRLHIQLTAALDRGNPVDEPGLLFGEQR